MAPQDELDADQRPLIWGAERARTDRPVMGSRPGICVPTPKRPYRRVRARYLRINLSLSVTGDALDDWLAVGVDGLSARTVTLYRGTIAKALREELGTVRLTELTAGNVQGALAALAARLSSRTVQIARNVLVRAIRQAERDDLVGRNVAALVKPVKGQGAGRPSKPPWSGRFR